MANKSKRSNPLFKRKSLIKRKSIKRKNKRNSWFIKKGGEGEIDQILTNLEQIRDEQGDFAVVEDKETDLEQFKSLSPAQLMSKLREIRNASDTQPINVWAEFGKKEIKREVSNYTDDIIKILLNEYDINSIQMLLKINIDKFERINKLDPYILQKYLPSNMWTLFDGPQNWVNSLKRKIAENYENIPQLKTTQKPPITTNIFFNIMEELKEKYPTINNTDSNIYDLIISDLFRKLYYLNKIHPQKQTLLGGAPFPTISFPTISSFPTIFELSVYVIIPVFILHIFAIKTGQYDDLKLLQNRSSAKPSRYGEIYRNIDEDSPWFHFLYPEYQKQLKGYKKAVKDEKYAENTAYNVFDMSRTPLEDDEQQTGWKNFRRLIHEKKQPEIQPKASSPIIRSSIPSRIFKKKQPEISPSQSDVLETKTKEVFHGFSSGYSL